MLMLGKIALTVLLLGTAIAASLSLPAVGLPCLAANTWTCCYLFDSDDADDCDDE